jgi:hypothetical protein
MQRWMRVPEKLRRRLVRRSLLLGESVGEPGTFVNGLTTYLLKLPPEQLAASYKLGNLDRRAAGAISSVAVRLRLRAVARLLADGLLPQLAHRPAAPLHLLNLGGGTASDSLNAVILIQRERPEALRGRKISIQVLDLDGIGPAFGARSLAALLAEEAPLHGLDASLEHVVYKWSDPSALRRVLAEVDVGATVVAASSEGALFEYGSDAEILANLSELHESTPSETFMVGSLFRDEPVSWCMKRMSGMSFLPRNMALFQEMVAGAGWDVASMVDGNPIYEIVCLRKR